MREMSPIRSALADSRLSFSRLGASELRDTYRLRYEVFCRETQLIPASRCPDGSETDDYDKDAIHVGAYDSGGVLVGSLRMVRSRSLDLPMFRYCHPVDIKFPVLFDPMALAEVSRLAVSKSRTRWFDEGGPRRGGTGSRPGLHGEPGAASGRSFGPEVMTGLARCAYRESKREGIEFWIVAMERSLHRLLKRIDVDFEPAGAPFDYYGEVVPYKLSARAVEAAAANRRHRASSDLAREFPAPRSALCLA
jgi:N-acyl amino acid synthase of PEP-CTERM/exosortase system